MVEFSASNCNLLFLDSTKISCFPILALKQDVTCLDNIMEEKEETWWIRDQLFMWGRAARGTAGHYVNQRHGRRVRGQEATEGWIIAFFMGMSVFGFVLPSDGKLCLQWRQCGHCLRAKKIGVNLIRSKLFVDVCTCLEQWREEGNRIL